MGLSARAMRHMVSVLLLTAALFATVVLLAATNVARSAQPAELNLDLELFATGLNRPIGLVNAGDARLFAVEKAGRIKIIEPDGTVLPTPFLDIIDRVNSGANEQGLLGLAFHPDYASNGYFYVNYTGPQSGTTYTRIARFQVTADPNVADPNSEEILLTVAQPYWNHNAGDIHFGPDGYLYVPLGDGGSGEDPGNNAQTFSNVLGMISRIDVNNGPGSQAECAGTGSGNYTVPADNPFADGPGGNCDEVWAGGLRNPWRSSFDPLTGDFFVADVGQDAWEEINVQPAGVGGQNYGWSCYEGYAVYNNARCDAGTTYTFPVTVYGQSGGRCAVIGGEIYRGSQFPEMVGHYFYTDYCTGEVWDMVPDGQGGWSVTLHTNLQRFGFVAFGRDMSGELYIVQSPPGGASTVYKLLEDTGVTPTPTPTVTPTASPTPTGTRPTPTPTSTPGPTLPPDQYIPVILNEG